MRKLVRFCDALRLNLGFGKGKATTKKRQKNHCTVRFEALETRTLLANLYWAGVENATWNTSQSNVVWSDTQNGSANCYFQNGDNVTFYKELANKGVKIDGDVQPASIRFKATGYSISTDNSSHILAFGTNTLTPNDLPITVDQTGTTPEFVATISAPIADIDGTHLTKLIVPASSSPDGTGKLVLTGDTRNTYSGETLIDGGILQAVKPQALPYTDSPYHFNTITVDGGSLIVQAGTTGEWAANDISTLLNYKIIDVPTTRFATGTNFGMSIDFGTAFEYSGVIPGPENFAGGTGSWSLSI
jgi:autotransporter-associated beta strand protein